MAASRSEGEISGDNVARGSNVEARSEIDAKTEKACQASMRVAELLEHGDAGAGDAYLQFYGLATEALSMHRDFLSKVASMRTTFLDNVSERLGELQELSEEATQLDAKVAQSKVGLAARQAERDSVVAEGQRVNAKVVRRSRYREELEGEITVLNRLDDEVAATRDRVAAVQSRLTALEEEMSSLARQAEDMDMAADRARRRGEKVAQELEAQLELKQKRLDELEKGSLTSSSSGESLPEQPPMIVHRTSASETDELRALRTAVEEALAVRSNQEARASALSQDISAARDENQVLKTLLRNTSP